MENITQEKIGSFDKYIQNPTDKNRNEVIKESLPLIEKMVARFQNGKIIERNDLFQEGVFGVMRAMEKSANSQEFNVKLYGYIKAALLNYANNQSCVTLNNYAKDKISKINNFILQYTDKYEKEPNDQEISEGLGIKVKNLCAFKALLSPVSEVSEVTQDENNDFDIMEKEDINTNLLSIIQNKLSEREQNIIKMKYGIGYSKPMTLEEIGYTLKPNLCKQRIDQIHKIILNKLKKYIQNPGV